LPQTRFPIQLMHPLLGPAVRARAHDGMLSSRLRLRRLHSEKRSVAAIRLVSQVDRHAALRAVVDSGADCVRLEYSANAGAQAIAEGADPALLLYASAHYQTVKRYLSMPDAWAMSRPLNFFRP
jgi:hypothetical protein